MSQKISLFHFAASALVAAGVCGMSSESAAVTLTATHDTELRIHGTSLADESGPRGGNEDLNARWNEVDRFEYIALQFDLSGHDKSTIVDASVNVTMHRSSGNNSKNMALFALDGETWDENVVTWSTMPGLDSNFSATHPDRGADLSVASSLGAFAVSGAETAGDVASIDPASLTTFIQGMTSDTLTVLMTTEDTTNGQWRIHSKESSDGAFAPTLTFVPEPSALGIIALSGLALVRRRRN